MRHGYIICIKFSSAPARKEILPRSELLKALVASAKYIFEIVWLCFMLGVFVRCSIYNFLL